MERKYIDAEKLIVEIERYKQGATIARFDNAGENADYFQGKVDLCDDLLGILDTLSEQPVEETPEPYTGIYDEAYLQDKIARATKSWKGIDTDKMLAECRGYAQPASDGLEEKDFVEEVREYYSNNCTWDALKQPMLSIITRCARHFAEWGRKQVLQEIYDGKVKPVDKITAAWLDDESKTKEDK